MLGKCCSDFKSSIVYERPHQTCRPAVCPTQISELLAHPTQYASISDVPLRPGLVRPPISYEQELSFLQSHVERLAMHDAVDITFPYQGVVASSFRAQDEWNVLAVQDTDKISNTKP